MGAGDKIDIREKTETDTKDTAEENEIEKEGNISPQKNRYTNILNTITISLCFYFIIIYKMTSPSFQFHSLLSPESIIKKLDS